MKKINVLNIICAFLALVVYLIFFLRDGNVLIKTYPIRVFYIGAALAIGMIFLAFLKKIRDGIIMDILYMIYLILFIAGNFLAGYFGKTKQLFAMYVNYPVYVKYVFIVLLIINVVFFIKSFKNEEA